MQRKIIFSVGEYYHIYNRGTDSRDIFIDDKDRERFVKLLFVSNGENPFVFREFPKGLPYVNYERGKTITALGAYCLMPNHFHFLLRETSEGGITKFMGKVLTSYSMYFNKKYRRSGRLFQGTFKASHADTDEYLKYLFSYIHLNPVKIIDRDWKIEGIKDPIRVQKHLDGYKFSSYLDYCGIKRTENHLLQRTDFPEYFELKSDFAEFIHDWLSIKRFQESTLK